MVDICDYCDVGQMVFKAKDEELRQLCYDLDDLFEAQYWWDKSLEKNDDMLEFHEGAYRTKLAIFKRKWFKDNDEKARIERLCEYVDKKVEWLREELYEGIGKAV